MIFNFLLISLFIFSHELSFAQKSSTVNFNHIICKTSQCSKVDVATDIKEAVNIQSILDDIRQVNSKSQRYACENPNKAKRSSLLKDNNFSACSTEPNQHKGLEPIAVSFPVGHKNTPKQVQKVLDSTYNKNELKALKGRKATAFLFVPSDKFKFNRMLKKGESFVSFKYGNDRFPYVSDKISMLIDGVNTADDQGLTGSGGLGYTKVLNNGVELKVGIDAELRTLRFGKTLHKDEDGKKRVDQIGVETTTYSLEALKRRSLTNSALSTKGVKLQFRNADAGSEGALKKSQAVIHEIRDMPITNNIYTPHLNEKSVKLSASYAFDKYFHTLNSNCFFKVGAKTSIGFVVTEDGHVEQSHDAELRASINKYIPKIGLEVAAGLNIDISYHNLSADNFSERSDQDIMGFETISSVDLGLRKGNLALIFEVSTNDNGIDIDELYYKAEARYYFNNPKSAEASNLDLTATSPDISKPQIIRTFK